MRDSTKWSMVAGVFTILGIMLGWKANYEQRKETEEDKEYFNNIATRIEGGIRHDA